MNVQLLGCIELRTDQGNLVPVSPTVGALLAALASSPNTFVSDEDVIERVWQDAPPTYPLNALYTSVTRLRKALRMPGTGEEAGEVIRRRGGYVLVIDAASVDACRFRALVRQAREAVSRDEDVQALRLYDEALSLWHGDPLSGIRTGWADGVRVTLRHEWRTAVLNSAEAGLRLHRHDDYCIQAVTNPRTGRVAGRWGRQGSTARGRSVRPIRVH